jgi:hypothetical protein
MTRSAIELLFRVLGPLAMLPEAYPRKPGMSDPDWRDELLVFSRGHCTGWLREICVSDPAVEHQLRVYHAGPFLTPPHRLEPARDVLWSGWSGSARPRQALSS